MLYTSSTSQGDPNRLWHAALDNRSPERPAARTEQDCDLGSQWGVFIVLQPIGLNIGALARRSGIPQATLRAWEHRYGIPTPERTSSGRRVYSDQDLTTVLRMRQLVSEGVAPARAAAMLATGSDEPRAGLGQGLSDGFAIRFVDACTRYDELAAIGVLDEVLAVYPVEQACVQVLVPALRRIGELWRDGGLPVATEHIASSLILERLAMLMRAIPSPANGPLAVLACAPGELHEIGPMLLGVFLKRRAWRVLRLGANTPIDEISRIISSLEPTAVVISATQPSAARRALERCRALRPLLSRHGTTIALGGQGFEDLQADPEDPAIIVLDQLLPVAANQLHQVAAEMNERDDAISLRPARNRLL
ncbi:MAG: MerR family transcriptional regulator [Chloroflexota bacterium]